MFEGLLISAHLTSSLLLFFFAFSVSLKRDLMLAPLLFSLMTDIYYPNFTEKPLQRHLCLQL